MPGAIATAFVDIIARLSLEQNNQLESNIREGVSAAEKDLSRLEKAGKDVGSSLRASLGELKINVDVRQTLTDMQRLDDAARVASENLRSVGGSVVGVDTSKFDEQVHRLEAGIAALKNEFRSVDGETLNVNTGEANQQLRTLAERVRAVVATLGQMRQADVNLDIAPAVASLRELSGTISATIKDVVRLGDKEVSVNVQSLGLDELKLSLNQINREIEDVSGKSIHINAQPAESSIHRLGSAVESEGSKISSTFERVALRLSALALIGGAVAGIEQLVSAGIQAAAQIETITVSLDRLFQGFAQAGKELGGTSSEFLARLKEVAIRTPFQFVDLGKTSARLVQIGTNLAGVADATGHVTTAADVAINRMNALADAGAGVGATAEDLNGVVIAISKIAARGTVTAIGLNQVATRLPNFSRSLQIEAIIDQLNRVQPGLHATVADFEDLRKRGLIPITVAIDGLFEGMKKIPGAAGAAAAQARTLTGALSNLKDFAEIQFADAFAGAGATIAESLNKAFSATGTKTGLATAIETVIQAAGNATQKALPDVLAFVEKVSTSVAKVVTAVGSLIGSLARGFGGNLFAGAIAGLGDVLNLLTAVSNLLNKLPAAVGEGIGQIGVLVLALTKLGINVTAPFTNLFTQIKVGVQTAQGGVLSLRESFAGLGASLASAGAAAAGLAIFQIVLDHIATSARRAGEVQQAINDATKSLKDFTSVGGAALDFIKQFDEAGKGIKLGDLESSAHLAGITVSTLAAQLGVTEERLADLVATSAKLSTGKTINLVGPEFDALLKDFAGTGKQLPEVLNNAIINFRALVLQFRDAAPAAFTAAVAEQKFTFVTQDQTAAIVAATAASGNYVQGLADLEAANAAGAQADFFRTAALENVSAAMQRAIITQDTVDGVIDYTKADADLRAEIEKLNNAFLDLLDSAPQVGTTFKAISDGTGDVAQNVVDFANAIADANVSGDQLEALAEKLGTTLTADQLGKDLKKISDDFQATLTSIADSLEPLGSAVSTAFSGINVDSALTGLDKIQATFDQFSLQHFIDELNKLVEARATLVTNLQTLANISTDAVRDLLSLKLDPTQLAVVTQSLVQGGQTAVDAFLKPFQDDAQLISPVSELVKKLVTAGVDPTLIAALTTSLQGTVDTALGNVDVTGSATRFGAQQSAFDQATGGGGGGGATGATPAAPGIDVPAAKVSAQTAGQEIAAAFNTGVSDSITASFATLNTTLDADIGGLGASAQEAARITGSVVGGNIQIGINEGLSALTLTLETSVQLAAALVIPISQQAGSDISDAFIAGFTAKAVNGASGAITASLSYALEVARVQLVFISTYAGVSIGKALASGIIVGLQSMQDAVTAAGGAVAQAAENGARTTSKAYSPSLVFVEVGKDLIAGLTLGISSVASAPARAMTDTINAIAGASAPSFSRPGASAALATTSLGTVQQNPGGVSVTQYITAPGPMEAASESARKLKTLGYTLVTQ